LVVEPDQWPADQVGLVLHEADQTLGGDFAFDQVEFAGAWALPGKEVFGRDEIEKLAELGV
jgi:hypothetical protein